MDQATLAELNFAINLGWDMGDVMRHYFNGAQLAHSNKSDGSIVTEADTFISDEVCRIYAARGRRVISEEVGTAEYGYPDAEILDPIDGTRDFEAGRRRVPPQSIAAFSMGSVTAGRLTRGVVSLPLVPRPRLLWAQAGEGAYSVHARGQAPVRLQVDPSPKRGIIYVTDSKRQPSQHLSQLAEMGFRLIPTGGAVFKACAVADPSLAPYARYDMASPSLPVVGFVSRTTWAHDHAAAAVIVREAGGLVCGLDGGALRLDAGKLGSIFAVNQTVQDLIVQAMR